MPDDIRRAIVSPSFIQTTQTLATNNNLSREQVLKLEEEIYSVIIGLTRPSEFAENIKEALAVTEEKAENIARYTEAKIFLPVRKSLEIMRVNKERLSETLRQRKLLPQEYVNNLNVDWSASIANFPTVTRQVIKNIDIIPEICKIGGQFELFISEIGELYEETKKIITGEARAENFVAAVREKLDDEHKNIAADVASAINDRVLIPIRNAFMAATGGPSSIGNVPQNTPAPAAPKTIGLAPPPVTMGESNTNMEYSFGKPVAEVDENLSKEEILREIEYPTPVRIRNYELGSMNKNSGEKVLGNVPPQNLPIGEPVEEKELPMQVSGNTETAKRQIPIVRTMQRDMAAQKSAGDSSYTEMASSQPFVGRGKFGHGMPPRVVNQESGSMNYELRENSKEITENQSKIPATNKVENIVQDKLTKLVGIPKEEKKYTVDPYRESLD